MRPKVGNSGQQRCPFIQSNRPGALPELQSHVYILIPVVHPGAAGAILGAVFGRLPFKFVESSLATKA